MKFSLKTHFFRKRVSKFVTFSRYKHRSDSFSIECKSLLETKFKTNCMLHVVESICFCWVASCKKEMQIFDRDITRLYLIFCTVHSWHAKEYKKGDVGQSVHENNKNQITLLYITLH